MNPHTHRFLASDGRRTLRGMDTAAKRHVSERKSANEDADVTANTDVITRK